MNKTDLIKKISAAGLNQTDAKKALDATLDAIKEALVAGDKVQLVGFGTFSVAERAARKGINPSSGAAIEIAAKKLAKFKAGADFEIVDTDLSRQHKRGRQAKCWRPLLCCLMMSFVDCSEKMSGPCHALGIFASAYFFLPKSAGHSPHFRVSHFSIGTVTGWVCSQCSARAMMA